MKSSKAVVRQRVEEVFRLRLGGAELHDIREHAGAPEQGWNVSDSQLRRYIQAADGLVRERFDARAEHLLTRHLLQRRQLYAHAMGSGDFRTALAVLQDEAKLEGLYPPTKIAPTTPDGLEAWAPALREASDEELAVMARLADRARQAAAGDGDNRGD
jgi:hypothetical protein